MEGLCENRLRLRACLYEMLALCLHAEPSQDTLGRLLDQWPYLEHLLTYWSEPTVGEGVRLFLGVAEKSDAADLAVDYARLFLGAATGSICPSESSYRDGRLFGEHTTEVRQFYARCGFATDDSFTEPDDHIAVECYFMAILAGSSLAVWHDRNYGISPFQDHIRHQLVFLKEHLSQWIETWAADVQNLSVSEFFKAVADLAVVVVKKDLDFLQALTQAEGFSVR